MLSKIAVALTAVSTAEAKRALLVVDVQDCFLEDECTANSQDGTLAVPACGIIAGIQKLRTYKACLFDEVVFSRDFHPVGHISYASSHGHSDWLSTFGKTVPLKCLTPDNAAESGAFCCPTEIVEDSTTECSKEGKVCSADSWTYAADGANSLITDNLACTTCKTNPDKCFDGEQALWPDHCMQTGDSNINSGVKPAAGEVIVKKGDNKFVDAYSAFMDNTKSIKTELDDELQKKGIKDIFIAGIATDVCVAATALDALGSKTGAYTVTVIKDVTAAVQGSQENFDAAITEMETGGVTIKSLADVLAMGCEGDDDKNNASENSDSAVKHGPVLAVAAGVMALTWM